jgi:uncharacterized membrane protein
LSELKTFLGFEEALEATIISVSIVCITLFFLLKAVPQDLVLTFLVCSIEGVLFFILERSNYVKKEVLKLFLVSLFYLVFSLVAKFFSGNLLNNEVVYTSYIVLVLFLSRSSVYLTFPSLFHRLRVVEEALQLKVMDFLNYARSTYLRLKKILFQRKLSEREALKLSRNALMNYLKNERSLEVLSKNEKTFSVRTLVKDKNSFIFLFKGKNLEFTVMADRVSRKIHGPLLVPSIKQLSYALSKHFGLDLKVVNMKYVAFGILEVGIDNTKGVYYEGTFDLVRRRLNIKNAFLSYKFFLTNYEPNLVLEDIKRIDNFKFEIIYSKGEEKHSDIVDVSNIRKVLVQKKS